jgi:hypothetical protein
MEGEPRRLVAARSESMRRFRGGELTDTGYALAIEEESREVALRVAEHPKMQIAENLSPVSRLKKISSHILRIRS